MKKKILKISISLLIFFSNFINVQALTPNFNSMDYTQQKQYIENTKGSIELRLSEIEESKMKNNEILDSSKSELIDFKREAQSKKMMINHNTMNNDNLKLWEMVLKSDSLSDLMYNLNTMKNINVNKNKELTLINKKEEVLVSNYLKADEDLKELETEYLSLKEQDDNLKELEDDLQKKMSRKSGELTYDPNNLLATSNLSVDDMYNVLRGTALYELAPVYIEAENTYGVNALFILGLSAEESAWGTSKRAVEDNNLTGYGVYNDSSVGINSNTKRDSLLMTAKQLKNNYLSVGGSYFNGYSINSVNTRYCIGYDGKSDYNWSNKINKIATDSLNKIK